MKPGPERANHFRGGAERVPLMPSPSTGSNTMLSSKGSTASALSAASVPVLAASSATAAELQLSSASSNSSCRRSSFAIDRACRTSASTSFKGRYRILLLASTASLWLECRNTIDTPKAFLRHSSTVSPALCCWKALTILLSSTKGRRRIHSQGRCLPLGSIGASDPYRSMMGEEGSTIRARQARGRAPTDSAGSTARSCSTGRNGSESSNAIL